jgi:hypothetical protein
MDFTDQNRHTIFEVFFEKTNVAQKNVKNYCELVTIRAFFRVLNEIYKLLQYFRHA